MVRKLALAVSLALGTLSVPAHALGLGELSSKSALNQRFSGDIKLLSVAEDELGTVRVNLADTDAFSRAGIDRPFFLTQLKFEPTLASNGRPVVRISSEFPIREPFLNFLIEVNWPNGRLLREYTVLLDPPTTTRRRPPSVAPVARASTPARAAPRPAAAPAPAVVGGASYDYGPVRANETAWSIAKKVRPGGVSMEQMMMALLAANPQAFVDGNINRLRKGQILRVPASTEVAELSRQEARQAYREQQDAWLARRDEKLRGASTAGATEQTASTSPAEADAQDQLRIATARPEGEGEAGAGDDDAVSTTASDLKSRLISARENAETSRQEAETLRSQVDDLQARLQDMQKLLSLKDDQLAQLQDRMATGEEAPVADAELADVTLANQVDPAAEAVPGFAADQVTAAVTGQADVPGDDYRIQDIAPQIDPDRIVEAGGIAAPAGVAEQDFLDIPRQIDPDRIVETAARVSAEATAGIESTGEAAVAVVADEADVVVVDSGTAGAVGESARMEAADAAQPPAPLAETVAPVETPTEAASDSLLPKPLATMLEQNLVPVAAGGAALLGLAGWLAIRRRRKPEAGSPLVAEAATAGVAGTAAAVAAPAAAAAAEADEAPAVDAPQVGADVLADLPDSTFLDDFSPEDINALQDETGEVDPVSEADVYIAYGRYQQAEELLRQALSRDPDRLALKHKLLEVHYATRDAVAFAALAQEMVDGGQDAADQAAWMRAQDMGRELAPDNPMFVLEEAGQGAELAGLAGSATATTATAAVGDEILSLDDAELSELTAAYEKEEVTDTESFEAPSEISITLDDLDAPAEQALASVAADEVAAAEDLPASISLDELETVDFELPEVEKDDAAASDVEEETSDSFDIENMMAEAEAAVDAEDSVLNLDSDFSAEELQAQLDELSDLSVLDSGEGKAEEGKSAEPSGSLGLVEADTGFVEDELDQPLNLDTAFDEEEPERQSADVIELKDAAATSGAGDEDDVTTKLDLARAYVEMGDEDGARSILEEVVAEGNDSQRGDAKRLLTKIG